MQNRFGPFRRASAFAFQQSNRNRDGSWEAPLADQSILRREADHQTKDLIRGPNSARFPYFVSFSWGLQPD